MKRILFCILSILCLFIYSLCIAEKGQKLTFNAHILGENEVVTAESLYSAHEINWVIVCSTDYLKNHLDNFEEIDSEIYAEDVLLVVVPFVDEAAEMELYQNLNTTFSVAVLTKDAKVNADQPVTCFVDTNGRLLLNEAPGEPFTAEMLDRYHELKLTDGEGFDMEDQTVVNETKPQADTGNIPNTTESSSQTNGNRFSITGLTINGEKFDSSAAFSCCYVNAFAVCESGTLEKDLEFLLTVNSYCTEQLKGSPFFIIVKGSDLSALDNIAAYFGEQTSIVLADNGSSASGLHTSALYMADWDGNLLAEPIALEDEEVFCYKYSELLVSKASDAMNSLKGRKFAPLMVTGENGEKRSTDEIFSENQLTVVSIWETTCNPCIVEMNDLNRLNDYLRDRGGKVVGFLADRATDSDKTVDELIETGRQLMNSENAHYDNYVTDSDIIRQVPFSGTPITLFVNQEGRIAADPVFGVYIDQIEKAIESLLR